jgi:CBS domain-containing protein
VKGAESGVRHGPHWLASVEDRCQSYDHEVGIERGEGAAGTSSTPAALSDVVGFLRAHPPFDALDVGDVERVAASVEVEFFLAGSVIFAPGAQPVDHLRVVRSGAVEIVLNDRVLDLLGPGELFGHASMLSGLPPGFGARAQEDTLCYRIPETVATVALARPESVGFVARSLLEMQAHGQALLAPRKPAPDPANQPVAALLRDPPLLCPPTTTIREAAAEMAAAASTSIVIELGDSLGILTDRDLRSRVLAAGVPYDAPVSSVMSAPAYTVEADRLGGDVLLEMLDRGVRHFPVLNANREVMGVVEATDLQAVETLSSFYLRRAIARAENVGELAQAALGLRPAVISLHESRIGASSIAAIYSVVLDALTRRLIELAIRDAGEPPAEFAWLALGSQSRREATPASDVDSAIVWYGASPETTIRPHLHALATSVAAGLAECGVHVDRHGATASDVLFVRSIDSWQRVARSWIERPTREQALILVSVLVDSRPVWGVHSGNQVSDTFRSARARPQLLHLLGRFALSHRPPTGFLRGLVVEHDGEHRGRLDLKNGGLLPVVDLARWGGMAAGVTSASTLERLRAAGDAGTLPAADVHTLEDAFELFTELRMEHQVEQLRAGLEPDDHLDPNHLSALTRSHLRQAFRAVASVQKHVATELNLGMR